MTSHNNVKRDFLLYCLTTIYGTLPWGTVRGHRDAEHTSLTAAIGACWCAVWAEALRGAHSARKRSLQVGSRWSEFSVDTHSFVGFKRLWPSVPQNSVSDATYHEVYQVIKIRHFCQCKRTFWLPRGDRKYSMYSSRTAICQPLARREGKMWSVIVERGVKLRRMGRSA
jgi:hypothetical protein